MKNKRIKWDFKFWFRCGAKSGYLYEVDMYLGKKGSTQFGLGESVILSFTRSSKIRIVLYSLTTFLQVQHYWSSF